MRKSVLIRFLAALVLLSAGMLCLSAQNKPKLLVLPLFHGAEIKDSSARTCEDLLVSSLMAGGSFEVSAQLRDSAPIDDSAAALALATEKQQELVMLSRLTSEGNKSNPTFILVTRLIAVDTGIEIYGRTTRFTNKEAPAKLKDLSSRVAVAARSRSDITPSLIQAFADASNWEAAYRYLNLYLGIHPKDADKVNSLRRNIENQYAAALAAQAEQYAAQLNYDEAIKAAKKAVSLNPDSTDYAARLSSLEAGYARYLAQSDTERLNSVQELLSSEKLDAAKALLEKSGDSAKESERGTSLARQIDQAIEARSHALEAQSYFDSHSYDLALAAVDEALTASPDKAAYIKLRAKILEAQKHDLASQDRFAAYKLELESFDYPSLYLSVKKVPLGLETAYQKTAVTCYPQDSGSWTPVTREPIYTLAASLDFPLPFKIETPLRFTALGFNAFAGLSGGYGIERLEAADLLTKQDTIIIGIDGGAAATFECLSFALRGEAFAEIYWLNYSDRKSVPSAGTAATEISSIWTFGPGLGLSFVWTPFKNSSLELGRRWVWPLISSAGAGQGQPILSSFRIALIFGLAK